MNEKKKNNKLINILSRENKKRKLFKMSERM